MKQVLVAILLLVSATSAFTQSDVKPSVTCWSDKTALNPALPSNDPSQLVTIVFGYTNTSASAVAIAVGPANYFTPDPPDRLQPSTFIAGGDSNAVRVTVTRAEVPALLWSINGFTATPNLSSDPPCSSTMVLSIAGPKGPGGPTGPAGTLGAIGVDGTKGVVGDQGTLGPTGPIGSTGLQGAVGPTGPPGATGPAGAAGLQGVVGAPGLQGPKGPTGDAGLAGPAGPAGPQGQPGSGGPKGATGAAGAAGPAGPIGPKGLIGDRGPQGPAGVRGAKGRTGIAGIAGLQGFRGLAGSQGGSGANGALSVLDIGGVALKAPEATTLRLATQATIIVTGAVELRTSTDASVGLTNDNAAAAPLRVPGGAGWRTYPVFGSFEAAAGEHVVRLVVPPGVEVGASSISITAVESTGGGRRRAVAGH